jgi:hypothetical protein
MAYYRGDFYRAARGDFYRARRGDWLSSALGAVGQLLPNSWTPQGAQSVGLGIAGAAATALGLGGLAKVAPGAIAAVRGAISSRSQPGPRAALPASGAVGSVMQIARPGAAVGQGRMPRMFGGRHRRMNSANPRALRRAVSRVKGFGKLVGRLKRDVGAAARSVGVVHHEARTRGKR